MDIAEERDRRLGRAMQIEDPMERIEAIREARSWKPKFHRMTPAEKTEAELEERTLNLLAEGRSKVAVSRMTGRTITQVTLCWKRHHERIQKSESLVSRRLIRRNGMLWCAAGQRLQASEFIHHRIKNRVRYQVKVIREGGASIVVNSYYLREEG